MDAIFLVKNGKSEIAFERKEMKVLEPSDDEVGVEVEAFGLNFADVMARLGLYKDCPPLPTIIGYEAVVIEVCCKGDISPRNRVYNIGST